MVITAMVRPRSTKLPEDSVTATSRGDLQSRGKYPHDANKYHTNRGSFKRNSWARARRTAQPSRSQIKARTRGYGPRVARRGRHRRYRPSPRFHTLGGGD